MSLEGIRPKVNEISVAPFVAVCVVVAEFWPFQLAFKICIEKTMQKMQNWRILDSRTPPKSTQNAIKIVLPEKKQIFVNLDPIFFLFSIFDFLKKCILPR